MQAQACLHISKPTRSAIQRAHLHQSRVSQTCRKAYLWQPEKERQSLQGVEPAFPHHCMTWRTVRSAGRSQLVQRSGGGEITYAGSNPNSQAPCSSPWLLDLYHWNEWWRSEKTNWGCCCCITQGKGKNFPLPSCNVAAVLNLHWIQGGHADLPVPPQVRIVL